VNLDYDKLLMISRDLRSCAYEIEKVLGEGHILTESDFNQIKGQYDILALYTLPSLEAQVKGAATR